MYMIVVNVCLLNPWHTKTNARLVERSGTVRFRNSANYPPGDKLIKHVFIRSKRNYLLWSRMLKKN